MIFPSLGQKIRTKKLFHRNSGRRKRSHSKRLLPLLFQKTLRRNNSDDPGTFPDHPSCSPSLKPRLPLSTIGKKLPHRKTTPSNANPYNQARFAIHPQDHERNKQCPYDRKYQKCFSPELDAQTELSEPLQGLWSYPPADIGKPPIWLPTQEEFLKASAPCLSESSVGSIRQELGNLNMEVPPVGLNSSLEDTSDSQLPASPKDISSPIGTFFQPRKKQSTQLEGTACLHLPFGIQAKEFFERNSILDENHLFDASFISKVDNPQDEHIIPPVHVPYELQSYESTPTESADSVSIPSCKAIPGHGGLKLTDSGVSFIRKEGPLQAGICKECGNSLPTGSGNVFATNSYRDDSIPSPANQAECSVSADLKLPHKTRVNGSNILNEAILRGKEVVIYGPVIQNLVAKTVTFEKVRDMRE